MQFLLPSLWLSERVNFCWVRKEAGHVGTADRRCAIGGGWLVLLKMSRTNLAKDILPGG